MTRDKAIKFLLAHQPMPRTPGPSESDEEGDTWEQLIEQWQEVIDYFIDNPCEEAIPLALNSLAELDDAYAGITGFMQKYPADVVIPHLIKAFQSPSNVIRAWAADLALDVDSGRADFIEALVATLADSDPEVREKAVSSFQTKVEDGYVDWRQYESKLKSFYERETVQYVKEIYEEIFEL